MFLRLVLLLAIAGGLVLFAWSNLQPMSLVFLGIQTPAFPLAFWILGAIAAGVLTSVCISILFSLSNFATGRELRSRFRQSTQSPGSRFGQFRRKPFQPNPSSAAEAAARSSTQSKAAKEDDSAWRDWEGYEDPTGRKQAAQQPATAKQVEDDWDLDSLEDWEEPTRQSKPVDRHRAETPPKGTDYEVKQEPKTTSRSGSVYSYGYRDPGSSGVGKQEDVVDAEYRVIIPPYQPIIAEEPAAPPPPVTNDAEEESAEDWFEDDGGDDFDRRDR